MTDAEPVLGIDLGTTTSCCAVVSRGEAFVLANADRERIIPSIVGFTVHGEVVGQAARQRLITDPENTVYSFKRLLGRRFGDPEVRAAIASSPYRVARGPENSAIIKVRGQDYSVPEIAARVVRELIATAEMRLHLTPRRAVIAVPASFDEQQRTAVRITGRIAGLEAVQIIDEPTAAALAFGANHDKDETLAVFDFGGGTLDVTVLRVSEGGVEVLGASGDSMLGGDDLDMALAFAAADAFRTETGRNLWRDVAEWQRLLFACEKCKRRLSVEPRADIRLRAVARTPSGVKDLFYVIDRARFQSICGDKVEQTLRSCDRALQRAGCSSDDVSRVLLVGGSSFIRLVRSRVTGFFGRGPDVSVDPVEAVALGAALHGAVWGGEERPNPVPTRLLNVCRGAIALRQGDTLSLMVDKNEPLPVAEVRQFRTTEDGQTSFQFHLVRRGVSGAWTEIGVIGLDNLPERPAGEVTVEAQLFLSTDGDIALRLIEPSSGASTAEQFSASR